MSIIIVTLCTAGRVRMTPPLRMPALFGRSAVPNAGNRSTVADDERLQDITRKLRCWGYLSHFPDAEQDVAWLIERLAERDVRIARLEARLQETAWLLSLP